MQAIVTVGQGGYDKLVLRDVPLPVPATGEVLLQVLAAGVNNTDINTRVGWYGSAEGPGTPAVAAAGATPCNDAPLQGWRGTTPFPLIQGADCCARVVQVAAGGDTRLVGARVLVRPCMRRGGHDSMDTVWLGTDFDGAFAQFVKAPATEVFPVRSHWSDVELATLPCAYGTAENMLHRAGVAPGDRVLVPGASGGVGSAVVQLARRRGATVTAITSASKVEQVRSLGAARVLVREDDVVAELGPSSIDVVVDNVAGAAFGPLLRVLRRGGRYVSSGAIGGALVTLDLRTMYLNDLTLIGCTAWDEPVFPALVQYLERDEIRPLVAGVFALENIADAQRAFLDKALMGNIVLVPNQQE